MNGRVTQWDDALGSGSIDGNFVLVRRQCSAQLQARLAGHAIPPGQIVPVTFQPVGTDAFNADLAADV